MTKEQRKLLEYAQDYCDENDKSTEYMLQFMGDTAGVGLSTVMSFLKENHDKENRQRKNKENKDINRIIESNRR